MQNIVEEKVNLMNKLARALAKDEGITEVQALARIKQQFMDRDETAETIKGMNMPRIVDYGGNSQKVAPEDAYAVYSEQTKVELKKLELQQKQLDADQKYQQRLLDAEQKRLDAEIRKQEYLDKKLEADERMQREKLDREEKLRREEIQLQRSQKEDDSKVERDRAHTEKLIMLSTLTGKKGAPDEMMEYLKSQSESTKEFYKAQGESQKGLYDTLLTAKQAERDREYEWKKELAHIEADREVEFEKLRHTTDSETALSTEAIVSMLAEKLDGFAAQNSKVNNADDFVKKMEEYNKMQDTVVKSSLNILKARGFSEDQLEVVRSAVSSEEDRQKSTIGRLWDVGKEVWKQIEPRILPPEQTPAQAMEQQRQVAEQQRLAREREETLRKDVELEASRLTAENTVLEQEKAQLKQMEETNRALQQKYFEQRDILAGKAMDLGIPVDDRMTNEQIFVAIEARDAEIEREHQVAAQQARERNKQEQEQAADAIAHAEQIAEQTAEKIEPVEEKQQDVQDVSSDEIEAAPEAPEKEAPGRKKKKTKSGKDKVKVKYTIYTQDGTELARVESNNHKNAGLKIANTLNGTPENPVRIKVFSESGEEKEYDAYSAMIENKAGTTYAVPRVKVVAVV